MFFLLQFVLSSSFENYKIKEFQNNQGTPFIKLNEENLSYLSKFAYDKDVLQNFDGLEKESIVIQPEKEETKLDDFFFDQCVQEEPLDLSIPKKNIPEELDLNLTNIREINSVKEFEKKLESDSQQIRYNIKRNFKEDETTSEDFKFHTEKRLRVEIPVDEKKEFVLNLGNSASTLYRINCTSFSDTKNSYAQEEEFMQLNSEEKQENSHENSKNKIYSKHTNSLPFKTTENAKLENYLPYDYASLVEKDDFMVINLESQKINSKEFLFSELKRQQNKNQKHYQKNKNSFIRLGCTNKINNQESFLKNEEVKTKLKITKKEKERRENIHKSHIKSVLLCLQNIKAFKEFIQLKKSDDKNLSIFNILDEIFNYMTQNEKLPTVDIISILEKLPTFLAYKKEKYNGNGFLSYIFSEIQNEVSIENLKELPYTICLKNMECCYNCNRPLKYNNKNIFKFYLKNQHTGINYEINNKFNSIVWGNITQDLNFDDSQCINAPHHIFNQKIVEKTPKIIIFGFPRVDYNEKILRKIKRNCKIPEFLSSGEKIWYLRAISEFHYFNRCLKEYRTVVKKNRQFYTQHHKNDILGEILYDIRDLRRNTNYHLVFYELSE